MADEPEDQDTIAPEAEDEELDIEQPETLDTPEADDLTIEIEGEVAEDETPLIKQLREQNRDQSRELAEYRKAQQPQIVVGDRPTLEEYEWDEDRHSEALLAWAERKRKAENQETEAAQQAQIQNQQWERQVTNYRARAMSLGVKDFDESENRVVAALPQIMQAAIIKYAKAPEKVVLALGKYPERLAKLAQITDPIELVIAVREMEGNLKVTNRKAPPAPEAETIQRGSASLAAGSDKVAEKLLSEAQRSGNMDKYRAHMKAKAK